MWSGNVEGNIVVGDNNFVVNNNHGTIVYKEAAPRVKKRDVAPKPPRKPKSFVGRKNELAKLENWISSKTPILILEKDYSELSIIIKYLFNMNTKFLNEKLEECKHYDKDNR